MNARDLILYLIVGGVGLLGLVLLATAPMAFRHYYEQDPDGAARNFAGVVAVRPRWSWFARALVVVALLIDDATWPARGAR